MKNIVVIGGGTGQSFILKCIKNIPNINIWVIGTVADDGGSTRKLRQQMIIPGLADARNAMCISRRRNTIYSFNNIPFSSR